MSIKIIGAGMAGLLAANMLRHHDPIVIEAQESLPNNHSAVLRFRSHVVGDVLGIQFKKVRMVKAPVPYLNPVADALLYSKKNTGVSRSDRSITDGLVIQERFIAPLDLIERMARGLDIRFGERFDFNAEPTKVISTIPMPALAHALDYYLRHPVINFPSSSGVNVRATIPNCDAYVSLMVPDPNLPFSRVSITGDEMIIEIPNVRASWTHSVSNDLLTKACKILGIDPADGINDVKVYEQRYSKILPIDEDERRNFIHWASSVTGKAYQLGRFATWRPNLLLDDLVKDVRIIDRWISSPTAGYDMDMLRGRAE